MTIKKPDYSTARKLPGQGRLFLSLILCCALLQSCRRFEDQNVGALVLALDGEVTVERANGRKHPLQPDTVLWPGDGVRTGPNGGAVLLLVPTITITLLPDTELVIDRLVLSKDGNETSFTTMNFREAEGRVMRGFIYGSMGMVERMIRTDLFLNMGQFRLRCRHGAIFSLTMEGGTLELACSRGEITVTNSATGEEFVARGGELWQAKILPQGWEIFQFDGERLSQALEKATSDAKTARKLERLLRTEQRGWMGRPKFHKN